MIQFSALRPVVEFEYPRGNGLHTLFAATTARQWPQNVNRNLLITAELERIAPEAVKIHQNNLVKATNGRAERVVGFFVNPASKRIIALIARRKIWWKTIEMKILNSQVDHFEPDLVLLKLNKSEVQKITADQWQKRYV